MFMVAVRVSPKRMLIALIALVLVVSASVTAAKYLGERAELAAANPVEFEEMREGGTEKKAKKVDSKKVAAKTNEQRVEFAKSFGWEIETEPAEVMEVIIPKEFDEVYKDYNAIQKMQGLDLTKHAGKRCKRYSYVITNHPDQVENVRINLLVESNKVIGGDVCSIEAGGFMHGFAMEAAGQLTMDN